MRNAWYVIGLIIIIGVVVYWMMSSQKTPTPATETKNIENNTEVATPTQPAEESKETYTGSGTFALNTQESIMNWSGRKPLITNYVDRGTVQLKNGSVEVKDGAFTSGSFVIDMTTIAAKSTGRNAGEDMLSKHLKSEDFFNVEKFPESTITVKSVVKKDTDPASFDYTVTADLAVKGIKNEVQFPATIYKTGEKVKATASISLDRSKWDIRYGSDTFFDNLGDKVIDNIFTIDMSLVFDKK